MCVPDYKIDLYLVYEQPYFKLSLNNLFLYKVILIILISSIDFYFRKQFFILNTDNIENVQV